MFENTVVDWVNSLMGAMGAPGAGVAIALENLFPPLPSEVILPLAGFASSTGEMNLWAAIVCTTIGSVVGALALYWIGGALGRERLIRIVEKMPLVKASDVERSEAWFAKHGTKAIFFGRFVPIFRSLISIPAGLERMRLPLFLALTTAGSLIWNSAFIVAGFYLGENWETVSGYVSTYSKVVLGVVGLFVVYWIVKRVRENRREKREAGASDSSGTHAHSDASENAGAHEGPSGGAHPADEPAGRTTRPRA
ncbi:DedA family protein [Streptomyces sp. NPDC060194]|uniref:DedA family protein n=1 Tax=Streptomyces sp. NPDC060194 TaxID=3347069 RepID=UPI003646AF39